MKLQRLLTTFVVVVGSIGLAQQSAERPGPATTENTTPRLDRSGDALPAGAMARLGAGRSVDAPVRAATSVVISPDGRTAASLTRCEAQVRLWKTATGKQCGEIKDHSFYSMAMAPGKSPRLALQVHE